MKLLAFTALVGLSLSTAAADPSSPLGAAPIPLPSLADDFVPQAGEDATVVEAIRNTLALYPFAIDGKNFDALGKVFAQNAVANYSAPLNVLTPLSNIESALAASLECVTTQHLFGTQLIDLVSPTVAESVTYYRAAHFGTGQATGQVVYAYGQYQDIWHRQSDQTWRIAHRNLVYMVCLR
ncbi:hypothetical protein N7510_010720 [Penicillium lagena]|uniref:uncharacterized protein n=1 Tax=Penicillium lagena TaxID=94218 RepID=UPI0025418EA2|nr:uncharacterized protein N7510_010720 [Penicillium lagena]KAJ5601186.1 hypothetical protein N7510_010720 [Penicillium lagena]